MAKGKEYLGKRAVVFYEADEKKRAMLEYRLKPDCTPYGKLAGSVIVNVPEELTPNELKELHKKAQDAHHETVVVLAASDSVKVTGGWKLGIGKRQTKTMILEDALAIPAMLEEIPRSAVVPAENEREVYERLTSEAQERLGTKGTGSSFVDPVSAEEAPGDGDRSYRGHHQTPMDHHGNPRDYWQNMAKGGAVVDADGRPVDGGGRGGRR